MCKMITEKNIDKILLEVEKHLNESLRILSTSGCISEEVAIFRNNAIQSINNSTEVIRELLHKTYLLK